MYRHRPALGASASRQFAFACWTGTWFACARCPLTRPLQPRGILLLDSLEDGFFPWPPKTTDEPHSSSLFSVQGEYESPPFSEKPPETPNDLFRSPARLDPFTQKTSIHIFRTCVAQRRFPLCTKGEGERLASVRIACRKKRQLYDRSMDGAPMASTGRVR